MNPLLYIVITVDVESSDSPGALDREDLPPIMTYGRIGQAYWGFPKILDILSRHQLNATFFISALQSKKCGEALLREICAEINGKGQDIQLHIHPVWTHGQRYMTDYSLQEQSEIIRQGTDLLTKWTKKPPIAYRGGAFYSLNEDTFKALQANGLAIDSTMYYGQPHCQYQITRNRVIETGGIIELPVTLCRVQFEIPMGPFGYRRQPRYIKTDINATSLDVLLQFVKEAMTNNLRIMNLFLHSYSFLDFDSSYRHLTPDYRDAEKFEKFLAAVKADPGVQIITIKRFHEIYLDNPEVFTGASDFVPEIRTKLGVGSLLRQGWHYAKTARTGGK